MAESDSGYKLLFSHPELVADLPVSYTHLDVYKRQRKWLFENGLIDPEERPVWRVRQS